MRTPSFARGRGASHHVWRPLIAGGHGAAAVIRDGCLHAEHPDSDPDVRGALAELEHPQRLLWTDLARPRLVFRSRRLCVHDPVHEVRDHPMDRHGGWRRAVRCHRPGARLSVLSPARALFHHRDGRDRRDAATSCSSIGTGSAPPSASRSRFAATAGSCSSFHATRSRISTSRSLLRARPGS